ncbi:hypothetical protein [Aquimarina sp. MMG016]|uniref:hypothetical protein n=1 Tax=Aquimarina sp. MMG016 TaxID=2822690 RepID=UPI001B3A4CF9|nr:hypothetical protein [Aquimarina sp. MMG016]MBQ4822808.1 hypothetical protein [Aquimarina sp. MMG016]
MKDYPIEIDDYLSGNMSTSEKKAFEERLDTDPALAEELILQKDMLSIYEDQEWLEGDKNALKTEEAKQLKSFFESEEASDLKTTIREVVSENKYKPYNKSFWFIGIAASIALLITISLFVFKDNSYDKLYVEYIRIEEIPSLVTRGVDNNKLLEDAQLLFEEKKYQQAISIFTSYQSNNNSIEPLSYIYLGVAYLELKDFDNALNQFELLKTSNTLQSKKANWYKAMVYLKENKKRKLVNILKGILSDENNYKFKEAQKLLEKIDK